MKPSNQEPAQLLGRLADSIDGILDAEMSSAVQNLAGGDATMAGELSDRDLPLLLGRMFVEGLTGRLCLNHAGVEKSVYVEAGLPVMAASTDPADRMLAMLMHENVIDARQYREAERVVDATGRKVGAVLVDLGFLRSDELLPAVRRHYESIILRLFAWDSGRWHIEAGVTAGPDRTRLLRHPAALVREGIEADYPAERMALRLGAGKNVFLLDTSSGSADITLHVALERREQRIPLLFDGVRSLEEVARAADVQEATVLRIAFALFCFGVLRTADVGMRGRPRAGLRDLSMGKERILARHALAMEGDYFKVLGVERSAEMGDIRHAHARLSKELSPEVVGPDLWHDLRTEIATIVEVLDEALRVLCTPVLRSAYQFNLAHGPDAEAGAEAGQSGTGG